MGEKRDVFASFSQRGQLDSGDTNSVKQIRSEGPTNDIFTQVMVGGRHDTHIDFARPGLSQTGDLLFLQHPQESQLDLLRDIPDFVEE